MTLKEVIDLQLEDWNIDEDFVQLEDGTMVEAKVVTPLDYDRYWHEFPKNEKHYSKKTGNRLYGCWIYRHRENAGAKYGDGTVVHHFDHNKHNNSKSNLAKISRAKHCIIDPNAKKHDGCKCDGCKNPHYSQGYCQKHYMRLVYRKK